MGDIQNGDAIFAKRLYLLEQPLYFVLRDRSGRFIHNYDARSLGKCPGDLNELDIRDRQVSHLRLRIIGQAFLFQDLSCFLIERLPVHQPPDLLRLSHHEQMLRDGKVRHKVQFLEDHGNSHGHGVCRAVDLYFFPVQPDLTLVRVVRTIDDLHQCRFPCPVLTDDRMDGSLSDSKRNIIQRSDTRK